MGSVADAAEGPKWGGGGQAWTAWHAAGTLAANEPVGANPSIYGAGHGRTLAAGRTVPAA